MSLQIQSRLTTEIAPQPVKMSRLILLLLLIHLHPGSSGFSVVSKTRHACTRECKDGGSPMECRYTFYIEWYSTMSKACFDCPFNVTDCSRPHCIPADGNRRAIMSVNRQLPGPNVQVCQGDTIIADVVNKLEGGEATSIHWHGQHLRNEQYMDGVAMLTQCPILQHSLFQYRFTANTPGTHYWHAHSGLQRSDGVFGPLVVRQPPNQELHYNAYDFDLPEHYVLINDWMVEASIQRFIGHHHSFGDNKPRSMMVNGKGAYTPFHHPETNETIFTPREVFRVTQGKRYRFRLASNGILNCPIQVSIDDHNLTMIASDGVPFRPIQVESFIVYGGERFDFIIHANQVVENYWIKFRGLADCNVFKAHTTAILRYDGAYEKNPSGPSDFIATHREGSLLNPWNTAADENNTPVSQLDSLDIEDNEKIITETADEQIYISFDFNKIDNLHFHHPDYYPVYAVREEDGHLYTPQFNHIANTLPPAPPLSQPEDAPKESFCNDRTVKTNCTEDFCECTHLYYIKLGHVVELILIDVGVTFNASHPLHLHGYSFSVVDIRKINDSVTVEKVKQMDRDGEIKRKLRNSVKKDTVIVPDGGFTIVRFHATNPGYWFFHCHLEWHVEVGMGLVFKVGETKDLPPVPKGFPKCGPYTYQELDEKERETTSRSTNLQGHITLFLMTGVLVLIGACGPTLDKL